MYGAAAYARVQQVAMSPREAESAVLLKAARKLQCVQENWAEQAGSLNEALVFNQKLWSLLATTATEAASPLPNEVKQSIARMAAFVLNRVLDTMADPSPDKLSAIITINHNLAAGLQGSGVEG